MNRDAQIVLTRLTQQPLSLADISTKILVGVQSGIDSIHVLRGIGTSTNERISVYSERADAQLEIEGELVKPFLKGEDVHRYEAPVYSHYCIYPYKLVDGKTTIIQEDELRERFPLGYQYLSEYKRELRDKRAKQKTNQKYWYSCHRSRDMSVFETNRIVTPEISLGCNMTFVQAGIYHNTMAYSILPASTRSESTNYWLGILNSPILWWFLSNTGNVLRGGYFRFKTNYLKPAPIRPIDFSNPTDVAYHDQMVALVQGMIDLHKQLAAAQEPHTRKLLQQQITLTDRAIDLLVYELYDLNEAEIAIVEGAGVR